MPRDWPDPSDPATPGMAVRIEAAVLILAILAALGAALADLF